MTPRHHPMFSNSSTWPTSVAFRPMRSSSPIANQALCQGTAFSRAIKNRREAPSLLPQARRRRRFVPEPATASSAFACERHQYSPRRDFRNDSSMRRPTATAPVHSFPGRPNPRTSGESVTRQESQNICSIGALRLADSGDRNPSAEIVAKGRTTA
jgi:hypothetical protein